MSNCEQAISGTVIRIHRFSQNVQAFVVLAEIDAKQISHYRMGAHVAVVPMSEPAPKKYGKVFQELFTKGFFNNRQVLEKVGTPEDYSDWIKMQRCMVTGSEGHQENPIVPAHIRTSDEAGTGYKNPYAEIPLLNSLHQEQHQKGYSEIGGMEKCIKRRAQKRNDWASVNLKFRLGGFSSFAQMPPIYFYKTFIQKHGLERFVPKSFKKALFENG